MEDRLARTWAHVQDGAVALLDVPLASDMGGSQVAAANQFRVFGPSLLQSCKMFLGNHQHVRGRLRLDVLKREDILVFVDFFRWNLAADDAAEKTIGSWICHGFVRSRESEDSTCRAARESGLPLGGANYRPLTNPV